LIETAKPVRDCEKVFNIMNLLKIELASVKTHCRLVIDRYFEQSFTILNKGEVMTLQARLERQLESRVNQAPPNFDPKKEFSPKLFGLLSELHPEFTPRQQNLVRKRREVLERSLKGDKPGYLLDSPATIGSWKIELPEYIEDQRNQMTGPADDAEFGRENAELRRTGRDDRSRRFDGQYLGTPRDRN
jgi:hypothetical protein